ncbi:conserved hypothetical protein [Halobacteriovorax marinus SJ]|uniref:Uncharacterized protein n=1 Tax=Halobacteriovorax marinus (strain ATCC BAA-682 / DSM 15412 / SJ) TaxID=862908 RepID=E1WY24_HALMS|nr:DUF6165 family protein [Halobacteriovorax marinus]CBW27579.1 conserved hypothetical protein [Halobacteriovorax marinus SJ]
MKILCEVSLGELVDKISILEIKKEKILDKVKNENASKELETLGDTLKKLNLSEIESYISQLREVNTKLWEIEDNIREYERRGDFSTGFIELARAVYITNDQRFALKNEVNIKFGSSIQEVKSYEEY